MPMARSWSLLTGCPAFDARSQRLLCWLLVELGEGASLEDPLPDMDEGDRAASFSGGRADEWDYGARDGRPNYPFSGGGSTLERRGGPSGRGGLPLPKRAMELSPQQLVGFLKTQVGQRVDLDCDDYSRPRKGTVEVCSGAPASLDLVDIREVEGGFELSSLWDFSGVGTAPADAPSWWTTAST